MRMNLTFSRLFFSFLLLVLLACAGDSSDEAAAIATDDLPAELHDFADFYQRFHADSLFQVAHISWPLQGKYSKDDLTGAVREERWTQQDWSMHHPIALGQDFTREIEVIGNAVVVETIRAKAGNYSIIRRFAKLGGEWNLIYYQVSQLG